MLTLLFWLIFGTPSLNEQQRKYRGFRKEKIDFQMKWIPFLLLVDATIIHFLITNLR